MKEKTATANLMRIALITTAIFIGGCTCTSPEAEKIVNIPDAYTKVMTESRESTGMQKAWINYAAIPHYNKAIVNVQLSKDMIENSTMDNLTTWRLVSSQSEDNKYVEDYAKESFSKALMNSKDFKLATIPGIQTLQINLYITQVVPGDGVRGAIAVFPPTTLISLMFMPISMGLHGSSSSSGGAIAMEIVIKDSVSHKILAVFATREKSTTAIINTDEVGALGAVRSIIDTWSKNLVATLDKVKEGQKDLKADNNIKGLALVNF